MSYIRAVVLFSLSLLSLGQQQSDSDCCLPPVSLFALASDLSQQGLFPGITTDFFLVRAGLVDSILTRPDIGNSLYIRVNTFPLILVANYPGVLFNLTITSLQPDILMDPQILPFDDGMVPTDPLRIHAVFPCNTSGPIEVVLIQVNVTTVNETSGKSFCPLFFTFGRVCNDQPSEITPEQEMEFMQLDYINDSISIPQYAGCNISDTTVTQIIDKKDVLIPILSSLVPLTLIVLLAMGVGVALWTRRYRRLKSQQREQLLQLEAIGTAFQQKREKWTPSHQPHEKEFPPDRLVLKRELGEGAFGTVYEGEADGILEEGVVTIVAVKQLRNESATDEFFREVSFMTRLQHEKIVQLLGVCGQEEPYAMIFEYMDLGDLCSFLRDAALLMDESSVSNDILLPAELVYMGLQIAEGMEYIASIKLVHRDLAARNCLVATGLLVKIGDFGLSRNLYTTDYYRVQGSAMLPVRWMAPESIQHGKFSEASDVYSYGVLLWEIFTLGQQPFAGYTNDEVIEMIIRGNNQLSIPAGCPMGGTIEDCWQRKPKDRPTFNELCSQLKTLLQDTETQ